MKASSQKSKLSPPVSFISVALASCFFISYLPAKLIALTKNKTLNENRWTGAGLMGSFAGAATYVFLPQFIAQSFLAVIVGIGFAILVSHFAEIAMNSHDDSRIVIDEWIGVWVAMWGWGQNEWGSLLLAFILFRIFDVFKGPWGNALQKLPGGFGVTLDDVGAGVIANCGTHILWHWIITL